MKTVTMYEADDGTQFRIEDHCVEYEQQCEDAQAANDMLKNGATLMSALIRANQTRPWWDQGLTLDDRVILMNTTKDTGFAVPHWQCKDNPGYKVRQIDKTGRIHLFGDVGSWNGSYGQWITLRDFLRYARQTRPENDRT